MPLDFQYDHLLLANDEIQMFKAKNTKLGYQFTIGYPNYRGTYLSCIEHLEFEVDGNTIRREKIRLCLNNKEFLMEHLPDLSHEYWFIREPMMIKVYDEAQLSSGNHRIKVSMRHRIPYTGYFGGYLTIDSVCEKGMLYTAGEGSGQYE